MLILLPSEGQTNLCTKHQWPYPTSRALEPLTLSLECLVDFSFSFSDEAVEGRDFDAPRGGGEISRGGGDKERLELIDPVSRVGEEGIEVGKGVDV